MAFIPNGGYCVFGPELSVEEEPYLFVSIVGFTWSVTRRTTSTMRVVFPINASGGEELSSTWTVGSDTYSLLSTSVDRGYGKPTGTLTAIYRKEGAWTPVIP